MKFLPDLVSALLALLFSAYLSIAFIAEKKFLEGGRLEQTGKTIESIARYEEATELLPDRSQYHAALGEAAMSTYEARSGNYRPLVMAEHEFQKAIDADPLYPYNYYFMAQALDKLEIEGKNGNASAEAYYRKAINIDPSHPWFLSAMMKRKLRHNDRQGARKYFNGLVLSYPPSIDIYGESFIQNDSDIKALERIIGLDVEANLYLASFLARKNMPEKAMAHASLVPESRSTEPDIAVQLSRVYRAIGKNGEAERVLKKAHKSWPRERYLAMSLASLYLSEGKQNEALAIYEKTQRDHPDYWQVRLRIARLAEKLEKDDLALKNAYFLLTGVDQLDSKSKRQMHLIIARIEEKRGDVEGAYISYKRALAITPEDKNLIKKVEQMEDQVTRIKWKRKKEGLSE